MIGPLRAATYLLGAASAAVLGLGINCSFACLHNEHADMGMMAMSSSRECLFSKFTSFPCDPSTGMMLYTAALLAGSLSLFCWLGSQTSKQG